MNLNPLGGIEGQISSTQSSANLGTAQFTITNPGEAFQFTQTYQGPGISNQTIIQRVTEVTSNRYYKYILPVIGCLSFSSNAFADVGGVSATANPIANSSGSVTNQAIQVLQGPYVTNSYGNGISCQGPTMNFTPYVTHSKSYQLPFERYYNEPQYNATDFKGRKVEIQQQVKNYPWEEWYDDSVRTDLCLRW